MADAVSKSKIAWLTALVERRSRRGWWAYVIWLLFYLLTAMMFADEMSFHRGVKMAQMWPLLIPIVILIVQWIRPTVLGWSVIFLPTFFYFGVGVYYLIANNLGPHPQWKHDPEGVILGSFFLAALLGVCVALMLPRSREYCNDMGYLARQIGKVEIGQKAPEVVSILS